MPESVKQRQRWRRAYQIEMRMERNARNEQYLHIATTDVTNCIDELYVAWSGIYIHLRFTDS
jgi:hypothetical protein